MRGERMSRKQEDYKSLAIQKIQEADMWWKAFDESVQQWRRMSCYQIGQRRRLEFLQTRGAATPYIVALHDEVTYAHDILLGIEGDIQSMARSAVSCEMAHRIYMEQQEQRFTRENNDEDWY
jgi:hypothetical protein